MKQFIIFLAIVTAILYVGIGVGVAQQHYAIDKTCKQVPTGTVHIEIDCKNRSYFTK